MSTISLQNKIKQLQMGPESDEKRVREPSCFSLICDILEEKSRTFLAVHA